MAILVYPEGSFRKKMQVQLARMVLNHPTEFDHCFSNLDFGFKKIRDCRLWTDHMKRQATERISSIETTCLGSVTRHDPILEEVEKQGGEEDSFGGL